MRILMVSDVYFPRINGVSTSIQTFKQEFEKQGHQVYLLTPDYPQEYEDDDSIIRIPSRGVIFDPEDRMMRFREIVNSLPRLASLELDLVHIHTPFVAHYAGTRIARELNLPCVVTYHTLFEEYLYHYIPFLPKQILRGLARRFSRSQCNQVDAVVAPSSVIVNLLHRYGVKQSVDTIPTGIHTERFRHGDGARFRQQYAIDPDKKLLLNVGRVAHEKNLGLLLSMLKRLIEIVPKAHLVIAGEGPAKNSCVRLSQQLGLENNISFVGYLDRETQLVDCYASADLFVFSSLTETQGLVLLESIAAGTPVVSVAAMGTKDILDDCPAAAVVANEATEFANTIARLFNKPDDLRQLEDNCDAVMAMWDSTAMANKMLEFYSNVLNDLAAQVRDSAECPKV